MTDATSSNPFSPPRAHVEDQFTTPLELVTATRMSRFLAVLIDGSPGLVIGVVAVFVALVTMPGLFSGHFDLRSAGGGLAAFGLTFVVFGIGMVAWLVWNIVLLYNYGQTVGKKVMGIRAVRMDGSRVSFARFFFLRGLATAVIVWIVSVIAVFSHIPFLGNVIGMIDSLLIFGPARRCLHDYIADTQVVTAESSPNATLAGARRQ